MGYTPDKDSAASGYHHVQLQVKRKDLTVQTREVLRRIARLHFSPERPSYQNRAPSAALFITAEAAALSPIPYSR